MKTIFILLTSLFLFQNNGEKKKTKPKNQNNKNKITIQSDYSESEIKKNNKLMTNPNKLRHEKKI